MKKVLILTLVLGMASTANALIVELGAGGVTNGAGADMETTLSVIEVVSDADAIPYVRAIFCPDTTLVDVTGITILLNAGSDATVDDYGDALGANTHAYVISANDLSPPLDSIVAGIQFNMSTTGMGQIQLLSEDLGTIEDTITIVPEPASMLLLGLGGLLLRRRR